MFRSRRSSIHTIVLLSIVQAIIASKASAHHPTIAAEAVCTDGGFAVIHYTSTSWSQNPGEGENSAIQILINGTVVDTQPYVYPGNSFSGTAPAPSGDLASVMAFALGDWGSGLYGGQSESTTVYLPKDCSPPAGQGRFTGGGHQIRVGHARVTRGLTIHCDLLLSNNLEVNWGGDHFHMTEHLTTVACTDDPDIIQAPPAAPLDTLIGVGTGRYNGADGYTIEFTLVDRGEPGRGVDEAALLIYETANASNVVLDVPLQVITGGNLQAHYDQPHR
jgi:hypothetical protein